MRSNRSKQRVIRRVTHDFSTVVEDVTTYFDDSPLPWSMPRMYRSMDRAKRRHDQTVWESDPSFEPPWPDVGPYVWGAERRGVVTGLNEIAGVACPQHGRFVEVRETGHWADSRHSEWVVGPMRCGRCGAEMVKVKNASTLAAHRERVSRAQHKPKPDHAYPPVLPTIAAGVCWCGEELGHEVPGYEGLGHPPIEEEELMTGRLKAGEMKQYSAAVRRAVMDAVNDHGLNYRVQNGGHMLLYPLVEGDRQTFHLAAVRPDEVTLRTLTGWVAEHVTPAVPVQPTEMEDEMNADVQGKVLAHLKGVAKDLGIELVDDAVLADLKGQIVALEDTVARGQTQVRELLGKVDDLTRERDNLQAFKDLIKEASNE